jgi:SSS family solute:Na+ symporter
MTNTLLISLLVGYFAILLIISYFTGKKADNDTFHTGNRNSKWYVVAFGMIGASLSGVTFISIPGTIEGGGFSYLQMALGYIGGYSIIAFVLLPMYYRMNLTSIYEYLEGRFGILTYKMGAAFFIVSRLIGASLRMYLVADVLHEFIFANMGVPFWATVALSILLIWIYTFKGGIKTIVWTDTLQTLFMLVAVGLIVYYIAGELNLGITDIYKSISDDGMGEMWQTTDVNAKNYWLKGLFGGMFLTLGMTGVDQDMMQKNLSVESLKKSQKNMMVFSVVLFFVNVLFVTLGGLLFVYLHNNPDMMTAWAEHGSKGDRLFPTIALEGGLELTVGIFFFLGLIAAAYSSADSALTSLTTSISVDFFNSKTKPENEQVKIRKMAHIGMSLLLLLSILYINSMEDNSIVWTLFSAANFTYGPLLGLFMFGVLTKRRVNDLITMITSIGVAIVLYVFVTYVLVLYSEYQFGSELLGINAGIVFMFLWVFSTKSDKIEVDSIILDN